MANSTITPSAGVLRLTTDMVPMIAVGMLALSGIAPTVGMGKLIAPSAGMPLSMAGAPATLGLLALIPNGALGAQGWSSTLSMEMRVATASGALAMVGSSPNVARNGLIATLAGTVGISGGAPTQSTGLRVAPAMGALSAAGMITTAGFTVGPGTAFVGWSGASPGIAGIVAPLTGAVTISSARVTVGLRQIPTAEALAAVSAGPGMGLAISPVAVAIAGWGTPPIIGTHHVSITGATCVMALSGSPPDVAATQSIATGALALTGIMPRVTMTYGATPTYLLPAAASIPIPRAGYYLLPAAA